MTQVIHMIQTLSLLFLTSFALAADAPAAATDACQQKLVMASFSHERTPSSEPLQLTPIERGSPDPFDARDINAILEGSVTSISIYRDGARWDTYSVKNLKEFKRDWITRIYNDFISRSRLTQPETRSTLGDDAIRQLISISMNPTPNQGNEYSTVLEQEFDRRFARYIHPNSGTIHNFNSRIFIGDDFNITFSIDEDGKITNAALGALPTGDYQLVIMVREPVRDTFISQSFKFKIEH